MEEAGEWRNKATTLNRATRIKRIPRKEIQDARGNKSSGITARIER